MSARGFTLLEITIVLAIIVAISTITYANFQGANHRGAVLHHTGKVVSALQTAQAYGVSGRTLNGEIVDGWGLHLSRLTNKYTLFADYNGNGLYDYATKLLIHGSESLDPGGPDTAFFNDSSNSAHQITAWNQATQESGAGQPNGSSGYWDFGSDPSYLSVAVSEDFDVADQQFSFDLWFKSSVTGIFNKTLLYLGEPDDFSDLDFAYRLYKDESDRIRFDLLDTNNKVYSVVSPDAIAADTWYHVAVGRDDSSLLLFLAPDGLEQVPVVSSTPIMAEATAKYWPQDLNVGLDAGCPNLVCAWQGSIDEVRLLVGSPRFTKQFFTPNAEAEADDENFKTAKLAPGIVFERLYLNNLSVNELNLTWKLNDPAHLTYANGLANASSSLIINQAGMEGESSDRNTPANIIVDPGGALETNGF
jgi:prepilin-type N-terminal cleavage/methylation domain-containing protein